MPYGTSSFSLKKDAKQLGSILTTKNLRLQTEYMGTRRIKITVLRVPVDISEDRRGAFSKFSKVEEVMALLGKPGIATGYVELQVTLTRVNLGQVSNT